jgi:hypothetical protein
MPETESVSPYRSSFTAGVEGLTSRVAAEAFVGSAVVGDADEADSPAAPPQPPRLSMRATTAMAARAADPRDFMTTPPVIA